MARTARIATNRDAARVDEPDYGALEAGHRLAPRRRDAGGFKRGAGRGIGAVPCVGLLIAVALLGALAGGIVAVIERAEEVYTFQLDTTCIPTRVKYLMYQRGAYDGTKDVVKRASLSPHGKPVVAMTERADEPGVWEARTRIKASEWGDRKYTFAVSYGRAGDAEAAWKTHGEGGYDGGESVASAYDAALNDAALRCADSDAGDGVWVRDAYDDDAMKSAGTIRRYVFGSCASACADVEAWSGLEAFEEANCPSNPACSAYTG